MNGRGGGYAYPGGYCAPTAVPVPAANSMLSPRYVTPTTATRIDSNSVTPNTRGKASASGSQARPDAYAISLFGNAAALTRTTMTPLQCVTPRGGGARTPGCPVFVNGPNASPALHCRMETSAPPTTSMVLASALSPGRVSLGHGRTTIQSPRVSAPMVSSPPASPRIMVRTTPPQSPQIVMRLTTPGTAAAVSIPSTTTAAPMRSPTPPFSPRPAVRMCMTPTVPPTPTMPTRIVVSAKAPTPQPSPPLPCRAERPTSRVGNAGIATPALAACQPPIPRFAVTLPKANQSPVTTARSTVVAPRDKTPGPTSVTPPSEAKQHQSDVVATQDGDDHQNSIVRKAAGKQNVLDELPDLATFGESGTDVGSQGPSPTSPSRQQRFRRVGSVDEDASSAPTVGDCLSDGNVNSDRERSPASAGFRNRRMVSPTTRTRGSSPGPDTQAAVAAATAAVAAVAAATRSLSPGGRPPPPPKNVRPPGEHNCADQEAKRLADLEAKCQKLERSLMNKDQEHRQLEQRFSAKVRGLEEAALRTARELERRDRQVDELCLRSAELTQKLADREQRVPEVSLSPRAKRAECDAAPTLHGHDDIEQESLGDMPTLAALRKRLQNQVNSTTTGDCNASAGTGGSGSGVVPSSQAGAKTSSRGRPSSNSSHRESGHAGQSREVVTRTSQRGR